MLALFLAAVAVTQAPPPVAPPAVGVTVAKANKSAISIEATQTRYGRLADGLRARVLDEKMRGHHGFATVGGVVQADGTMTDLVLTETTGSAILDEAALALMTGAAFQPAKDKSGKPLPTWTEVELQFPGRFRKSGSTGGLTVYRCDQFVSDMDWWKAAVPNRPWARNPLYKELSAINFGASMLKPNAALTEAQVESDWTGTLAHCRAKPAVLLVNAWQGKTNLARTLMVLVG